MASSILRTGTTVLVLWLVLAFVLGLALRSDWLIPLEPATGSITSTWVLISVLLSSSKASFSLTSVELELVTCMPELEVELTCELSSLVGISTQLDGSNYKEREIIFIKLNDHFKIIVIFI